MSNLPPNRGIQTGLGDTSKARIFFPNGQINEYEDGAFALQIYYSLPKDTRAAFRAAGDTDVVLSHDYVTSLGLKGSNR